MTAASSRRPRRRALRAGSCAGVVLLVAACTPAASVTGGAPSPVPSTAVAASADAAPGTDASASPSPSNATASPSPSPSPSPTPTSVVAPEALGAPAPVDSLVLGDSISLGIANALSGYGYPVIGLVGQSATSSYLREHLSSPLAQSAKTWVIELGTNNSGSPEDVANLPELVALIDSMRTPGAKQQVRWVTPHRPPSYIGTKTAYNLDAFNAELSLLAMTHKWLRILDFDALAKAHPEWFEQDTAMHLHPNADGQAALIALITGPAPAPVSSRAPVIDAGAVTGQSSPEPEVFDNRTLPAAPPPTPDVSPDVAVSPSPIPATPDETSGTATVGSQAPSG